MQRIVISASRRTDIPALYMPWFMNQIARGYFEVINPYNQKAFHVPATADQVHSIVFWSKNFGPFIHDGYCRQLSDKGYHLFFNFTINSPNEILEPCVPPLKERLDQLTRLAGMFGPETIQWRFDPICHYTDASGASKDNLDHFEVIAQHAAGIGIPTCITSFVDLYKKVQRRSQQTEISFVDPPLVQKIDTIVHLDRCLANLDIDLQLCCEKELLGSLPARVSVSGAQCIPNHKLAKLYGPDLSLKKDTGQRVAAGCGCRISRDIGSYQLHPCRHNCLFCYANPSIDTDEPLKG